MACCLAFDLVQECGRALSHRRLGCGDAVDGLAELCQSLGRRIDEEFQWKVAGIETRRGCRITPLRHHEVGGGGDVT